MDKEHEEMQKLGFFGIYKESLNTILSWKKIFTQITISFILPLSFIFLAHITISDVIESGIERRPYRYNHRNNYLYHKLSSEWIGYWIFRVVYLIFILFFSLLSTSAVVYTIASIYSDRDVIFKNVVKIVPRVYKRLALTCLWTYLWFLIYTLVFLIAFFVWDNTTSNTMFSDVVFHFSFVVYCIGFIYMTATWQLASVVTVLEDLYGLKAIVKANALIKEKRWLAFLVYFGLYCIFLGILILFMMYVENNGFLGLIVGIMCVFVLTIVIMFSYVAQTVVYFVCKSYHGEAIDKLALSSKLGGYLGEVEPGFKVNKDIDQLGKPHHPKVLQV